MKTHLQNLWKPVKAFLASNHNANFWISTELCSASIQRNYAKSPQHRTRFSLQRFYNLANGSSKMKISKKNRRSVAREL